MRVGTGIGTGIGTTIESPIDDTLDLASQFITDDFVGIQGQHPVAARQVERPVLLHPEPRPVGLDDTRTQAPRNVEAEKYPEFYRQLTMDFEQPLLHLHLSTDAPVDLHTILFVPARRERGMIERRIEGKISSIRVRC